MQGHSFDPTVLREYDIRGIVGETLGEEDAYAIGRTFGSMVSREGGRRVCVGRDGRVSSQPLAEALARGLMDAGVDVLDIGLGPTPMLYFAVHELEADGGIMVTGSHNPPDHNGFKMMIGTRPFFGAQIQTLGKLAAAGWGDSGSGRCERHDIEAAYVERLLRDVESGDLKIAPMAVAWDPGNGSAGRIVEMLTERLPGRHILLNAEIDGSFPNHHPDPTKPETLEQLIETVRARGLDLGIAFDGDGDRIGAVDGQGRIVWGDQLLAILARDLLIDRPGATVIADVKASQVLFDEIAAAGGEPLLWRTGHSLIKTKMAETGAPLAGEMSGHIFFADRYYGFDDAIYAAVRLLAALTRAGRSLAELRDALPEVVNTPEIRLACPEERKFELVKEVRDRLRARGARVLDIDGVRVSNDHGWWLLRASNTQAVLVARCEAQSQDGLAALKSELADELRASGLDPSGL